MLLQISGDMISTACSLGRKTRRTRHVAFALVSNAIIVQNVIIAIILAFDNSCRHAHGGNKEQKLAIQHLVEEEKR